MSKRTDLRSMAFSLLKNSGIAPAGNVYPARTVPLRTGFGTAILVYLFKDEGHGNESGSAPVFTKQVVLAVEIRVEGSDAEVIEDQLDDYATQALDVLLTDPSFTRLVTRFPGYGIDFGQDSSGDLIQGIAKIGIQAEWRVDYQPVIPNRLEEIAINRGDGTRTPFAPTQILKPNQE